MKKAKAQKRTATEILALEKRIAEIQRHLGNAKADQRNPLSREFPSAIEGHDNLDTTLTRELENAQGDLALLRQVTASQLDFRREKFLRQQLPEFMKMRENVINIVAGMQAELAAIERAKQLLL